MKLFIKERNSNPPAHIPTIFAFTFTLGSFHILFSFFSSKLIFLHFSSHIFRATGFLSVFQHEIETSESIKSPGFFA